MTLVKLCAVVVVAVVLALLVYMIVHPEMFGFFELAYMALASVAACAGIAGAANLEKETF